MFSVLLDSILIKSFIWLLLPMLVFRPKDLFVGRFPWLACLIILCAVTAFLHTVRLLNGLGNTYVFFDPIFIVFSVSAGVIEELSFRGAFYMSMEELGFWPASITDGFLFALFHYPSVLAGHMQELFSLRSLLIFVMGVVFCWMFRKWRNLALNMTIHSAWNLLSYLFCLAG